MKILFCAELYYPSIGGVQEVIRQLAERMVCRGHDVTVATTRLDQRLTEIHAGVKIKQFAVSGNAASGMHGEVDNYREFLKSDGFDIVLIYAAQQWTFDAAWDVLSSITARKVLVPCGYSGLHDAAYAAYFREMPAVLRQFDALVYHATQYRDFVFGAQHGLDKYFVIPNGADEKEFSAPRDAGFRARHGIAENDFLILTVGSLTGKKGHLELTQAFEMARFSGQGATLLLNGNPIHGRDTPGSLSRAMRMIAGHVRTRGWHATAKILLVRVLKHFGIDISWLGRLHKLMARINSAAGATRKKVVLCDLPRTELIQAYLNANLFVFASNIEYSPLVLFEACAAGLPFLSASVGNAVEIAEWTRGGETVPVEFDQRGFAHVAPAELAKRIEALAANEERLFGLAAAGREACLRRYNWHSLCDEYEQLFHNLSTGNMDASSGAAHVGPQIKGVVS